MATNNKGFPIVIRVMCFIHDTQIAPIGLDLQYNINIDLYHSSQTTYIHSKHHPYQHLDKVYLPQLNVVSQPNSAALIVFRYCL